MAKMYDLPLYPEAFQKILEERKSYAILEDKENIHKGDRILFHERDNTGKMGRIILTEVINIIDHTALGLPTGYMVLGVQVFQKGGKYGEKA